MIDRRRHRLVERCVPFAMSLALVACGSEPDGISSSPRAAAGSSDSAQLERAELPAPAEAPTAVAAPAAAPVVERAEPAVAEAALQQADEALDQPAIWPAPDVVYTTPEEAASDFVSSALISEGDPILGDFQPGDARSGEITVLFAGETGDLDPPQERGTLIMRQLGPTDGWYVIAATSDGVILDEPAALDEVPAGGITVSGAGRSFEGTLAVSAFAPGDAATALDTQIGSGGAFDELEPFSVELDLTWAPAGDVVVILVQGDTGLGSDPSTFAGVPVVIADDGPAVTIPPTK